METTVLNQAAIGLDAFEALQRYSRDEVWMAAFSRLFDSGRVVIRNSKLALA